MDLDKERGDDGVDGMEEGEAGLEGVEMDLEGSMAPRVDCDMMSRSSKKFLGDLQKIIVYPHPRMIF